MVLFFITSGLFILSFAVIAVVIFSLSICMPIKFAPSKTIISDKSEVLFSVSLYGKK